jgi:hypothetical protein
MPKLQLSKRSQSVTSPKPAISPPPSSRLLNRKSLQVSLPLARSFPDAVYPSQLRRRGTKEGGGDGLDEHSRCQERRWVNCRRPLEEGFRHRFGA